MPGMNDTDTNFERTFADLAFARLRDKAPMLLDFLLGFQIIDKDDEGTKAIGVFGFKVGGEFLYGPSFFINGEIKGTELLYLKEQDAFVPLTEEWVNYVLNRRPASLGKIEKTPRNQLGLRQPDFDLFARVPYIGSKFASAHRTFNSICKNMSSDFVPFMDVFLVSPASDAKYASLNKTFTLPTALNILGKQAARNLFLTMQKDEEFADSILGYYSAEELTGHEKSAEKVTPEEANYQTDATYSLCKNCKNFKPGGTCAIVEGTISSYGSCKYFSENPVKNEIKPIGPLDSSIPLLKASAEAYKLPSDHFPWREDPKIEVKVITRGDDTSTMTKDLTDEDKTALMRNQYIVKDERSDDRRSRVYRSQLAATLSGPTESGIYNVMDQEGQTNEVAIILKPIRVGKSYQRQPVPVVAIDLKNKSYGNFHGSDLLTTSKKGDLDSIPGLVDATTLKDGDVAFIVGPGCKGTNVFSVDSSIKLPDGGTELSVYGRLEAASSSSYTKWRRPQSPIQEGEFDGSDTIVLSSKKSKEPLQIGGTLFLPDSFKAFVIAHRIKDKSVPINDDRSTLGIGSMNDLVQNLTKSAKLGIHQVRLINDGLNWQTEVDCKQGPKMSKVAMIKNLIINHGLGQVDAESLIKEATPRKPKTYYIKYAADSQPNPAWFPEPLMGAEYGIPAPIQYPQTMAQNLGPSDSLSNREFYRDDRMLDMPTKRISEQAGAMGQKEVMDTSVITGLVKTMDPTETVDGYIGDLLLALDRLGRILFCYYWHYEKFKERYGQQDMGDLEDNIRNCFKQLGELTLFLKQKTVEPDKADTEADLTSVLGTGG